MPDPLTFSLTISQLGGLGDGIGLHEDLPVFVAKSCVGDVLRVRETHRTKANIRAEIVELITAGPERAPAPCPHYASCGGCSLQHLTPDAYQTFKKNVVHTALGYAGFPDTAPQFHFLPENSRRRADFKVEGGTLAYLAAHSHEKVPVAQCRILTPTLQALVTPLNALLAQHPGVRAVQLTEADSGVDLQIDGEIPEKALQAFAEQHDIARLNTLTRRAVTMRFSTRDIALPPGAFLQASQEAEKQMRQLVLTHTHGAAHVIELFSGLGTYSFALAEKSKVSTYELEAAMVDAMRQAAHPNIKALRRDLFKNPLIARELAGFDAAVINPPRMGASAQILQLAQSKLGRIVMVSCNHATWSRDAKTLKDAGYNLVSLDVIDQFVYSPHVELVSVFRR